MREDWIECKLDDVCDIYAGVGFPKNKQGKLNGDYPFYKVGDISKNIKAGNRYLKLCDNYIDKGDISKAEKKLLPPNSIAFAKIGEALKLNRRGITIDYCLVDNNAIGIKANNVLTDLFLYFFFLTVQLEKYSRATTVPSVRKSDIETIKLFVPPLVEQKAIVNKIEELFSSLDSGIADLKKAQDQLVIYRQAVLKKAFEGELTKEWREKNKIRFDWKNTTTGEVMPDISSGSTPKAASLFKEGEIQFLKVYNLNFDGSLNEKKDPAFTTYKIHSTSNKRAITKAGDVLINIVGPPLGKTSMIPLSCKVEFNINQAIVRFRPNEKILPKFLSFFMQNPETINWLEGTSKATAGQYNIKVTTCRVIPISLPHVVEQHQILQEIESRLSVCDKVEESIAESLEKAQALRQSILKKAFEGKLLSEEEITKCKANKAYEPASVLLERIRAEKNKK